MTEKQALRNYCQQAFDELYIVDSIVNMTKSSCMEQEFNGQYYGASCECSKRTKQLYQYADYFVRTYF